MVLNLLCKRFLYVSYHRIELLVYVVPGFAVAWKEVDQPHGQRFANIQPNSVL